MNNEIIYIIFIYFLIYLELIISFPGNRTPSNQCSIWRGIALATARIIGSISTAWWTWRRYWAFLELKYQPVGFPDNVERHQPASMTRCRRCHEEEEEHEQAVVHLCGKMFFCNWDGYWWNARGSFFIYIAVRLLNLTRKTLLALNYEKFQGNLLKGFKVISYGKFLLMKLIERF